MTTAAYRQVIAAPPNDRLDLFLTTANRLGTPIGNVEKDFWVCWTLNALYHERPVGGPRLLFKGGTSLSKAYGLIERFSEDIDITVFRDDLDEAASVEELEALSNKKRRAKLDAIRDACRAYITGSLYEFLSAQISDATDGAGRVEIDEADPKSFAERCQDDRHHFRFIVSPEDAVEIADLKTFTHNLMDRMEKDLGTKLDWVGVDHWNTEHPHVHVIVRGRADDGQDLVISRDYIKEGMRARAQDLITQELGPRTDHEIRRTLERQIDTERWTQLDRQLTRDGYRTGVVDLAPHPDHQPDEFHALKVGRLRKLESLGLADQIGPGQWVMSESAEATLRELGERGDIIKRIHRSLMERGIERGASAYVLAGESLDDPVIGRLVDRGLDDELKGTAYAVVDGVDGRTHHVKLPDLDAAGDSAPGSIVELRKFDDAQGRRRVALAVRSDLSVEHQVTATGATWLDRQAIAREPVALGGGGFGAEVREAMNARAEHLIGQGFAERQSRSVIFARNLIDTLRRREVDALGEKLAVETGRSFGRSATGEYVAGTYRQRFALASGRFAMIDDGLGFQLVPWSPSLEKQLGKHVSGVARGDGGIDWGFGRKRGLGL